MVEAIEYSDSKGDLNEVMVPFNSGRSLDVSVEDLPFDFEEFRRGGGFTDRLDAYFRDAPGTHPFLDAAYGFSSSSSRYGHFQL